MDPSAERPDGRAGPPHRAVPGAGRPVPGRPPAGPPVPSGAPGPYPAPPSAERPPGLWDLLPGTTRGSPASGVAPEPAGRPGPAARRGGPAASPGPATGGSGGRLRSLLALARQHPLEAVAVLLLGVGGLVYPFPLWLLGAAAIIASRLWDARDKCAALGIQVAFALVAAIAIAGLTARSGGLAGYASTIRIDGWDLIRAGSLVAAGYLAWRVPQGRRPRREPPWRRPPPGTGPPGRSAMK